jgi:hypothetical protein
MLYTKHTTLTDTTLTELFRVPNGFHAVVSYVFVANHDGSTNSIDLYWDLDTTPTSTPTLVPQVYIFDGTNVAGGGKETIGNGGGPLFVLHENEGVQAQAGAAGTNGIEVVVTFDLIDIPPSLVNFNGS